MTRMKIVDFVCQFTHVFAQLWDLFWNDYSDNAKNIVLRQNNSREHFTTFYSIFG